MSRHEGGLSLDGLTELSDVAAESLSCLQGALELGLAELSDAAAESLSKCKGELSLFCLTELSDSAAKSLAKMDPENLKISETIEEQISAYR